MKQTNERTPFGRSAGESRGTIHNTDMRIYLFIYFLSLYTHTYIYIYIYAYIYARYVYCVSLVAVVAVLRCLDREWFWGFFFGLKGG